MTQIIFCLVDDENDLSNYKVPYEDRHDADDESIASDDVGELDNGLVFWG